MRILVTGGSGLVGWEILKSIGQGSEVRFTYFENRILHPHIDGILMDVRDSKSVHDALQSFRPDVIIHAAAVTDVDFCETHPETAREVNVEGTQNVISAAEEVGAKVVFLSSSFVFDGEKELHRISDKRNPINEYGRTKLEAENKILNADVDTAIVRTDQPYGWSKPWQSQTMVEWVLDQLGSSECINIFDDWYNVPIYLPELANIILTIANDYSGIFHAVGPDYVSRYEWAKIIVSATEYPKEIIKPISSKNAEFPASRPNVHLDNFSVHEALDVEISGIDEGISLMLSE